MLPKLQRFFAPFLVLLLALSSLPDGQAAGSQRPFKVEDVPNVQINDSLRFTSDPGHFLTSEEVNDLDQRLHQLRLHWGIDVALVVLPSIGDVAIEDFSVELFRSWGLGSKKTNSGLLILLAMDVHKIFITTGYGLEGVLPDITCSRIIRNRIIPYFKEGQYAQGLMDGIKAINEVLETGDFEGAERTDKASGYRGEGNEGSGRVYWILLIYLIFVAYGTYVSYQKLTELVEKKGEYRYQSAPERLARLRAKNNTYSLIFCIACLPLGITLYIMGKGLIAQLSKESKRCPNCQKEGLVPISDPQRVYALLDARMRYEVQLKSREYAAMQCTECGHEHVYPVKENISRYSRCPNCGTYAYCIVAKKETPQLYITYYKCLYCDHQDTQKRRKPTPVNDAATGAIVGGILGGLAGRGGSSGGWGSSGGGWGGGSTGGGGAGGSW